MLKNTCLLLIILFIFVHCLCKESMSVFLVCSVVLVVTPRLIFVVGVVVDIETVGVSGVTVSVAISSPLVPAAVRLIPVSALRVLIAFSTFC